MLIFSETLLFIVFFFSYCQQAPTNYSKFQLQIIRLNIIFIYTIEGMLKKHTIKSMLLRRTLCSEIHKYMYLRVLYTIF